MQKMIDYFLSLKSNLKKQNLYVSSVIQSFPISLASAPSLYYITYNTFIMMRIDHSVWPFSLWKITFSSFDQITLTLRKLGHALGKKGVVHGSSSAPGWTIPISLKFLFHWKLSYMSTQFSTLLFFFLVISL